MLRIAVINPTEPDGIARTFIDGAIVIAKERGLEFRLCSKFEYDLQTDEFVLSENEFIAYAKNADLVVYIYSKRGMNSEMANKLNLWNKTVFLDGSEVGRNRRYDQGIQKSLADLTYRDKGMIDVEMLKKCALYFRREKPYTNGIIPLPYGIETLYSKHLNSSVVKDIDFFCVFGQEEYPVLRKEVREYLEKFCKANGFMCFTTKTNNREDFYKALARSKVGISVGGGGFDTYRFWEIMGNNCLIMTETIDLFENPKQALPYSRIHEFSGLPSFAQELEKMAAFLKKGYDYGAMQSEYKKIMNEHTSKARVQTILNEARKKKLI